MQNSTVLWLKRVYYASCLVLTLYVLEQVVRTAEMNSYSLMYAAWIAPMIWQAVGKNMKDLVMASGAMGERVRVPDGTTSGKAVSKVMDACRAGDAINDIAVAGAEPNGDLVYDYWHSDWVIYMVVRNSNWTNAVWTTSVSVQLWMEDMRRGDSNALHIIKLTNISKEEWNRESPAPCLLIEGRSRTHISAFLTFCVDRYGVENPQVLRRAQMRSPPQDEAPQLAAALLA